MPKGSPAVQRDLDMMEECADGKLMMFQDKSKALHLGSNNPLQEYSLGTAG